MLVGPVRIVDEEGKRPLVGQPRAQPVQAVKPCEQAIVGAARSGTSSNNGRASPAAPAKTRSRSSSVSGSMLGASS